MVKRILGNKMLRADFFSTLCYSMSFPYLNKLLISNIDYKFVAVNALVICISIIILSILWQKYEGQLFKRYKAFLYAEVLFYGVILALLYANRVSYLGYYLIETALFSAITKNVIMGGSVLKQVYFKDAEQRKRYDIQQQMTVSVASIIGYGISITCNISLEIALVFCFIGISVDNVYYAQIYKQCYSKYVTTH